MKKIKKAGLRIACLLFGLTTFTACYGPAPYINEPVPSSEEQPTKADTTEEAEDTGSDAASQINPGS